MSSEIRKRVKPPTGLFFTSLEMREQVEVRVDFFFMSLKTRKRVKTPTGLFSRALKRGSELGPGGPLFQAFIGLFWTGIFFNLARFFCLTRFFLLIFIIVL